MMRMKHRWEPVLEQAPVASVDHSVVPLGELTLMIRDMTFAKNVAF